MISISDKQTYPQFLFFIKICNPLKNKLKYLFLGPAPDSFTDKIYENSKKITQYKIATDVGGNYLKEPLSHEFTVFK